MFHPDSFWNKPISNPLVLSQYQSFLNRLWNYPIYTLGIDDGGSAPAYEVDSSTPFAQVCNSRAICETIRVPADVMPDPKSDAKLILFDRLNGRAYAFWHFAPGPGGYQTGSAGWCDTGPSGDGITNYWAGGGGWGGRATGWNYIAGLITPDDIRRGYIDHALAISLPVDVVHANLFDWPALATDGNSYDTGAIREGMRLQLDPSINVDSLPLSPGGKIIARCLQIYGAWVSDTGSATAFYCQEFLYRDQYGVHYDTGPWAGLLDSNAMNGLPLDSLRAIAVDPAEFYPNFTSPPPPPPPPPPPVVNYTLTIGVSGKGSTDPAAGSYTVESGTSLTIMAYPGGGWAFVSWLDESARLLSTSRSITVQVNANMSLTAVFAQKKTGPHKPKPWMLA